MDKIKNIFLIGFMGSGKTTTGKILASMLGFLFIDLDRVIEITAGMDISAIFEKYGESCFRDIESEVVQKICKNEKCIFSCGGGVILREENMKNIRQSGKVVYLQITPEESLKRLKTSSERPLLEDVDREEKIRELLLSREPLYLKYPDITVDTVNKKPEEVAAEIICKLNMAN